MGYDGNATNRTSTIGEGIMNLTPRYEAKKLLADAKRRIRVATKARNSSRATGDYDGYVEAKAELTAAYEWYGELHYMVFKPHLPALAEALAASLLASSKARLAMTIGGDWQAVYEIVCDWSAARREVQELLQTYGEIWYNG